MMRLFRGVCFQRLFLNVKAERPTQEVHEVGREGGEMAAGKQYHRGTTRLIVTLATILVALVSLKPCHSSNVGMIPGVVPGLRHNTGQRGGEGRRGQGHFDTVRGGGIILRIKGGGNAASSVQSGSGNKESWKAGQKLLDAAFKGEVSSSDGSLPGV